MAVLLSLISPWKRKEKKEKENITTQGIRIWSPIQVLSIARNGGHFTPVINCQRHLIFKMADKNYRSQGKRVPYDILNNLSSVDLSCEGKSKKKKIFKKYFRYLPGRAADNKETGRRCA